MVVKPATQTPLSMYALAQILAEAGRAASRGSRSTSRPATSASGPSRHARVTPGEEGVMTRTADVAVVGAGIVGLALADAVLAADPARSVVVLDKESALGAHAS